ncbi:RNA polymerase II elongation factor ELL-like [Aulostomus maculatus]
MSALKEQQCYGLSSGKLSRGLSVFHVKLTDSAARAISTFHNSKGWSSHPTICFTGNQGRITIPCSKDGADTRVFMFGMTNVAQDNPNGSFDCIQQHSTGAAEELSCLGVIQKKMTVKATDDSYDKALQSMAQVEEETRSRGTIVIKHGGRYQGKKVTVRAPAPALASLTKPHRSSQSLFSTTRTGGGMSKVKKGACASNRRSDGAVQGRLIRERVIHLLALRPYKKPELILRLQKDGLTAGDKDMLDSVLMEVGQLNSRDKTFVLKNGLYKELQKDWPGYTSGDQQLLKRILVRRLFQPQPNLLSVPEAQVSPLRDTPNSSPAHRPKHFLPEEYIDPPATKKLRISHLSSRTASDKSSAGSSERAAHKDVKRATAEEDERKHSLDPRKLLDSLSSACQQEAEAADRLKPTSCGQEEPVGPADPPQAVSDRLNVTEQDKHTIKKKKSKHKHKHRDQEKARRKDKKERSRRDHSPGDVSNEGALDSSEPDEIMFDSQETPHYLTTFTVIRSHEQRQSYKQEFNKEYNEYRDLHARIDKVTRQFMDLDTQLKQLHHESHKYKTVHNQILQNYRHIKKSNPNYNQDKIRCEYLHNKLAHIKKLISEYDHQQLSVDHPSPNYHS